MLYWQNVFIIKKLTHLFMLNTNYQHSSTQKDNCMKGNIIIVWILVLRTSFYLFTISITDFSVENINTNC